MHIMKKLKEKEVKRELVTSEDGKPAEKITTQKFEDAVYTPVLTIFEHFNG